MSSLTLHLHTENNPDVMSHLLHQLGLSPSIGFHDVYSIDDADLLAFVPRPAYALLFVFPVSETYEKFRLEEDEGKQEYEGSGPGEEVMWFKQTIRNACGLIGLLHGVSNGEARNFIGISLEPLRGSDTECFYTRPNFRSLHPPEICNTSEGCSSRRPAV